ncbi:MAG: Com family DNA-binding transcriptional regulator [Thermodesulfovibrionales bacterium]
MKDETRREDMSPCTSRNRDRHMKEIRCRKCNRLLMKGEVEVVEIKCPKCGYVQRIDRKGEVTEEAVQAMQIS